MSILDSVDFVPMRRTSVLLLLSLSRFEENQSLISAQQSVREDSARLEVGLLVRYSWVSSA